MSRETGEAHTPTPWMVDLKNGGIQTVDGGVQIANTFFIGSTLAQRKEERANAAYIVKAVNSHAALVEALRGLIFLYEDCDGDRTMGAYNDARATLISAGEES